MNKLIFPILLSLLILSGCGGIAIIPSPASQGQINAQDLSITQTYEQVTVTAKVMDLEVRPYQMQHNICSFMLTVKNDRDQKIYLPAERFILSDSQGNQFRPVLPEKIREIIADRDPYLIPYPYVGYYYEGDADRARAQNDSSSQITYFPTKDPKNIAREALPDGKVEPHKQISGLIYFLTDLRNMDGFSLEGSAVLSKGVKSSDFIFPFSVVKK